MNSERHVLDKEKEALLADPVKLLAANRAAMKAVFPGQGSMMHCLCSLLCTAKHIELDAQRVKDMRTLVRSRVKAGSPLRDWPLLALSTLLSMSFVPEDGLERVQKQYNALKRACMRGGIFLAEAAFWPLMHDGEVLSDEVCAAASDMMRRQRRARPFLDAHTTGVYALTVAASGVGAEQSAVAAERGYKLLRSTFPATGMTYALARLLGLRDGETEHACERVIALYKAFRAAGMRYGRQFELPTLGMLAMLAIDPAAIVAGIKPIYAQLKNEKGMGPWSMAKEQRLLYAAALYVISLADKDDQKEQDKQNLLQAVIAAFSAAEIAATSAYIAAATAAAASGG